MIELCEDEYLQDDLDWQAFVEEMRARAEDEYHEWSCGPHGCSKIGPEEAGDGRDREV